MVVTWSNSPFLKPQLPPGVVSPEDFGIENTPKFPGVEVGGVGTPGHQPQVDPIFAPGDVKSGGMFGDGKGGGSPNGEEGDFPSAAAIERRRKLAEALMGKQMEVNHPMQAVANAVSQIAGAWIDKRADDDLAKIEKRRREMVRAGFDTSGGDFDKMMDEWMKSGDPELVDRALDYKLRKAAAEADGGKAPVTRTFYEGNTVVTKQWNPETKTWDTISDPSPRWKGGGSGESQEDDPNWDPNGVDPSEVQPDPTTPGTPAPGSGETQERTYKTPGPGGKWQVKPGPTIVGPDGRPVATFFNPNDRQLYYQGPDGLWRIAKGPKAPTMMTPQQYVKLRIDYQNEVNGMDALNKYFQTVKDIPTGVRRWAIDVSAKFKTFMFNGKPLTPDEFNLLDGRAKIEALLGLFRETIVGPGVMTEYDAIRILRALGGDPASALQNPQVMEAILRDLYERKRRQAEIYYQEYVRQAKARGETPEPFGAPLELGGESPGGSPGTEKKPSDPGSRTKTVLPPRDKRVIGKTEYTAPDGRKFVWGRDSSGKVGWMPK